MYRSSQSFVAALVEDLVMRVADRLELEHPGLTRFGGQTLRLTGDGKDLAASGPNLLDDSRTPEAAQLAAAGRSPEAAIEDQNGEGVFGQLGVQPASPHPDRRVEERRDQGVIEIGRRHLKPIGQPFHQYLLAGAAITFAQHQPELEERL